MYSSLHRVAACLVHDHASFWQLFRTEIDTHAGEILCRQPLGSSVYRPEQCSCATVRYFRQPVGRALKHVNVQHITPQHVIEHPLPSQLLIRTGSTLFLSFLHLEATRNSHFLLHNTCAL